MTASSFTTFIEEARRQLEEGGAEAGVVEAEGGGQADIAQADHADGQVA